MDNNEKIKKAYKIGCEKMTNAVKAADILSIKRLFSEHHYDSGFINSMIYDSIWLDAENVIRTLLPYAYMNDSKLQNLVMLIAQTNKTELFDLLWELTEKNHEMRAHAFNSAAACGAVLSVYEFCERVFDPDLLVKAKKFAEQTTKDKIRGNSKLISQTDLNLCIAFIDARIKFIEYMRVRAEKIGIQK